ncbi:uncharacterized protein [Ptychodera flava]|uniref:uncharacterized protein n=1 Tax=Ptychodera flava TaxID=63121 RepID=UPI00396A7FF1
MNYNAPRKVAEALAKIVTDKDADILDIGCCTGLVGQELYKVGYRNIDGIDISDECIKIAMAKNVYRKIVNEIIDPEKQMSFQSCCYDVVMLVGGGMFLDIKNLKEWLRLTKKDGFTIIGVMQSEYENEKYAVPQTIEEYIDQGLATRVSKEIVPDYITGKPGVVEYLRPVIKEQ